jgi:hypothetical protein
MFRDKQDECVKVVLKPWDKAAPTARAGTQLH